MQLTADQVVYAWAVVAATKALALPQQAAAIAVMSARQESNLLVLANPSVPDSESYPHQGDGYDHDGVGLFQQRPSRGWGTVPELLDAGYASSTFLAALAQVPSRQALPMWQAPRTCSTLPTAPPTRSGRTSGPRWPRPSGRHRRHPALHHRHPARYRPRAAASARQPATATAYAQLGKPYQWGGTGPDGHDCSGLTMTAYRAAFITLPRTAEAKWSVGWPSRSTS